MSLTKLALLCSALWTFTSCTSSYPGVDTALGQAGKNRSELEHVLKYYSRFETDSLKLRAAEYLIANMPGHRCLHGTEVDSYYREIYPILHGEERDPQQLMAKLNQIAMQYPIVDSVVRYDIEVVTADYLIHNIEQAFRQWESPTANYLTFDQFCEWLLPYKVAELQPLDYWRDTLSQHFTERLRNDSPNDENYNSPYYKAFWINAEARLAIRPNIPPNLAEYKGYKLFGASSIYRLPFGDCFDYTTLAVAALRSHAVPAVFDYLPQWGRGFLSHSWFAFFNDNGDFMSSPWGIDSDPATVFHPWAPIPKIYRHCYAADPFRQEYISRAKYHLPQFTQVQQDVTDQYISTTDPQVPLLDVNLADDYLYIAAFNNFGWNAIDIGSQKNNRACFQKMGRKMAYIVLGFDGRQLVPASLPFTIATNGQIQFRKADTTKLGRICVTRKMPKGEHVARLESRLVGGCIQASDYEDFRVAETLYVIDSTIFPDLVPLHASKAYKYWRMLSADGSFGSISELQFFMSGSEIPAAGRIIGTPGYGPAWGINNVFDGSWLTSYDGPDADGNWYGMAFDQSVTIDRFRCAPRTDDNLIHSGDTYELKYWGGQNWVSLGKQIAKEKYLVFDKVPANAILWLSDLTQGREERIFTYENERQVWW